MREVSGVRLAIYGGMGPTAATWEARTVSTEEAWKTGAPRMSSASTQPNDHTSTLPSQTIPSITSGARYHRDCT